MKGVAVGVVLACSAFLLGILTVHWHADYARWDANAPSLEALQYYTATMGVAPIKYTSVLVAVGSVMCAIFGARIIGGSEANLLFDGASLFLVGASGMLYANKIMPIAVDRQTADALRDIASSHAVLYMALLGIIALQSAKYYSERLTERERLEEVDARLTRRIRQLQQQARDEADAAGTARPSFGPAEST
ncbi:hypothetical protein MCUN1_003216 [Malassezia cuniculi]|uniref:ER membrane protein SH3 n=1 Tax=Malassezia cuniculi TaxID=948313 RepID=A0AAF0F109_9BASI|nr:hypothetical protein MCUN1_003216 [Malassezia cuniculi]